MIRDELSAGGLIDAAWYRARYPDVARAGADPLDHYVRFGAEEGRAPSPYFDAAWYRARHPEAGSSALDVLLHYQREGDRRGLRPMPHFDPAWYRASYAIGPDVPALPQFLAVRATGRYLPVPELYAVPHLDPHRDDAARGIDPFEHYLRDVAGQRETASPDPAIVAACGLLDANHYLIHGSDVHAAGVSPAEHFCRYGWREGRQPNIYFDTRWYLQTNPRVAQLGINPLVHYLLEGEAVDRRPAAFFDPGWYRRTYGVPADQSALAHYLAHRRSQTVSPTPLFEVGWFVARHRDAIGIGRDPFAWYLQAGTLNDLDPSPSFDAAAWRRRRMGRPSRAFRHLITPERDNPLVHCLRGEYR